MDGLFIWSKEVYHRVLGKVPSHPKSSDPVFLNLIILIQVVPWWVHPAWPHWNEQRLHLLSLELIRIILIYFQTKLCGWVFQSCLWFLPSFDFQLNYRFYNPPMQADVYVLFLFLKTFNQHSQYSLSLCHFQTKFVFVDSPRCFSPHPPAPAHCALQPPLKISFTLSCLQGHWYLIPVPMLQGQYGAELAL